MQYLPLLGQRNDTVHEYFALYSDCCAAIMVHHRAGSQYCIFSLLKFGTFTDVKLGLFIDEMTLLSSSAPTCLQYAELFGSQQSPLHPS